MQMSVIPRCGCHVVYFSYEYRSSTKYSIAERKDPNRPITLYSSKASLYMPGVRRLSAIVILDFHGNAKSHDRVTVQRHGTDAEGRVGNILHRTFALDASCPSGVDDETSKKALLSACPLASASVRLKDSAQIKRRPSQCLYTR